jgi:hypothetical protein
MKAVFLGLALVCTGCVTTTGQVLPTGKDTYMVTASGVSGPFSKNELDAAVIKANKFCASKGQIATIAGTESHGTPGWTQIRATVQFTCTAA